MDYEEKIRERWVVDASNARLFIHSDVDDEIGMFTMSHLDRCEQDANIKSVLLDINSDGGSVYPMWGMIDRIRAMETPVVTVCSGRALSAAFMLLASGKQRKCYRHSLLMFHGCNFWSGWMKSPQHTGKTESYKEMDEMLCQHLGDVTRKKRSHWSTLIDSCKDRYISAQEALEWGVIDEIL